MRTMLSGESRFMDGIYCHSMDGTYCPVIWLAPIACHSRDGRVMSQFGNLTTSVIEIRPNLRFMHICSLIN